LKVYVAERFEISMMLYTHLAILTCSFVAYF